MFERTLWGTIELLLAFGTLIAMVLLIYFCRKQPGELSERAATIMGVVIALVLGSIFFTQGPFKMAHNRYETRDAYADVRAAGFRVTSLNTTEEWVRVRSKCGVVKVPMYRERSQKEYRAALLVNDHTMRELTPADLDQFFKDAC